MGAKDRRSLPNVSRTVIRTGFGVFNSVWWQPFVRATGFASNTPMVTTLDGGLTPADTLANPFPNGLIQPTGSSLGLRTLLGSSSRRHL